MWGFTGSSVSPMLVNTYMEPGTSFGNGLDDEEQQIEAQFRKDSVLLVMFVPRVCSKWSFMCLKGSGS